MASGDGRVRSWRGIVLLLAGVIVLGGCSGQQATDERVLDGSLATLGGRAVILDDGVSAGVLEAAQRAIEEEIGLAVVVMPCPVDFSEAWVEGREQYNYSTMLKLVLPHLAKLDGRVVVLTPKDTFGKNLNWSSGVSYIGGPIALVSAHRLDPIFWDEPADAGLHELRVQRIVLHELGHTFGRAEHCADWNCCIHSADSIEEMDQVGTTYCPDCRKLVDAGVRDLRAQAAALQD